MACRTSSSTVGASAISPLRTPRERAWPRPTMFRAPSSLSSPTTAQTLEVPISRPTIMEEGSNMLLFNAKGFERLRIGRRDSTGFEPARGNIIRNGQIESSDGLIHFLTHVENFMPPAQLLI